MFLAWEGRDGICQWIQVSAPKTDKPTNYLRFLPSKMSRARFLVPGSHTCLGPLTLLELWQLFHSNHEEESLETIMTIQLSLPSSTLPMILPTEGLFQPNAGIWVSGSASFLLPENFLPYRTPSHKPWRPRNSKLSVVSSFEGLWRWNSFQISSYIP